MKLYVDTNKSSSVDSGDTLIASGTFADDNGTLTLVVDPAFAVPAGTTYLLVTYDF